ncbi:hypothetical protein ANTPLA_LOCUS9653 [Anthophora plagiata]
MIVCEGRSLFSCDLTGYRAGRKRISFCGPRAFGKIVQMVSMSSSRLYSALHLFVRRRQLRPLSSVHRRKIYTRWTYNVGCISKASCGPRLRNRTFALRGNSGE